MELRTNRSESGHARYDAGWTALLHPAPDDDHPGRACGRQVRYKQRALILAEGDEASAVYEVIEGGVILFKLFPTVAARSSRFSASATSSDWPRAPSRTSPPKP
jgi:hypothetical protein